MSKTLAVVRKRLNSHNPAVRKILSEILIMIASHLKINATFITKTSHVCNHWRITLLSCPDLWTHLNFAQNDQALSFLRRSGSSPIHVDLTSTSLSQPLIELLCLHSARVYTLKIGRFDGLHKIFCLPLASLKTLEVATSDEWSQVLAVRSAAREFIALASLIIRNSSGALAFRGSRITRLRVALTVLSGLGVAELLSLLRSCVLLEELEMDNEIGLESGLLLLPDEAIPLPHLRSFTQTLRGGNLHTAGILDNLSLPPSCSVLLRSVGHTNGYPRLSFPNLRNTSYYTNIKRFKVVHAGTRLGYRAVIACDIINDRGTRFSAAMWFFNHTVSLPGMGDDGIKLSMPVVEVLYVNGHRHMLWGDYQCLTTLILSGTVVRLHLESLAEPKHRNTCKNLRTLVLSVTPSLFTSDLARRLLGIAQTRAKAGLSFKAITFACRLSPAKTDLETLEELKECVVRVELLLGDDALDFNLDKYFLDGL